MKETENHSHLIIVLAIKRSNQNSRMILLYLKLELVIPIMIKIVLEVEKALTEEEMILIVKMTICLMKRFTRKHWRLPKLNKKKELIRECWQCKNDLLMIQYNSNNMVKC
jgi:hypothetical protein